METHAPSSVLKIASIMETQLQIWTQIPQWEKKKSILVF